MANQCPNCGKSIRPGAKFCGFCGHVIGQAKSDAPQAAPKPAAGAPPEVMQSAATQVKGAASLCPHCGKPNRPGVKFCASCGKQLAASAPPPAPSPQTPPPAPTSGRKRSRLVTIGFLVGVLMIVCISLFGIAWGFGWLEKIFPSDTTPTAEDTIEESPMAEDVLTPSLTIEPEQIQTEASEPTQTDTPTITLSPTETSTPTLTSTPSPETVFIDDFTGGLEQWETWANQPVSSILPAETILGELLDLKGFNYDKVGVTAIQTITLVAGMAIDFEAEVDNPLNSALFFDWYPGAELRKPNSIGPFYLVIDNEKATFNYQIDGVDSECSVILSDSSMRLYRIEFGADWLVKVYFEDSQLHEICSITIDEPENFEGHITFSGFGLVDSIIVTKP